MTKKNMVLGIYQATMDDPGSVASGLEEIKFMAEKYEEEFKNLIDLFDHEKDVHLKLLFSDILVDLNYLPVKKLFIDLINDEENRLQTCKYGEGWSHLRNKIWAAGNLLRLNDNSGAVFLESIIPSATEDQLGWIASELYSPGDPEVWSKLGLETLLAFADKYEAIAKRINRKEVEERLLKIDKLK